MSTSNNYSLRQIIPSKVENGGYEAVFIDKEKCSTARYGLSLVAAIITFGGALASSDIRNAVFNKEVRVKKTFPLNSEESRSRIDTLWKDNFKDSKLNKAKLLEQEVTQLKRHPHIDKKRFWPKNFLIYLTSEMLRSLQIFCRKLKRSVI